MNSNRSKTYRLRNRGNSLSKRWFQAVVTHIDHGSWRAGRLLLTHVCKPGCEGRDGHCPLRARFERVFLRLLRLIVAVLLLDMGDLLARRTLYLHTWKFGTAMAMAMEPLLLIGH